MSSMKSDVEYLIEKNVNLLYNKYISKKDTSGKFICNYEGCGKHYSTEEALNRHILRHSSIKQHICNYCGKTFLRKSEKEIHERVHTGVKPFSCSICEKKFARITDLKIHMIYHSDEKPIPCPFPGCVLRFKRKIDAKKHLRIHLKRTQGEISDVMMFEYCSAFKKVPKKYLSINKHGYLCYRDSNKN